MGKNQCCRFSWILCISRSVWVCWISALLVWCHLYRENGVDKLLQDINPSKASGPDEIPNRILKECASQIAPSLTVSSVV
jgi:hypothetical protein